VIAGLVDDSLLFTVATIDTLPASFPECEFASRAE